MLTLSKYKVLKSEGTEDELMVVLFPYSIGSSLITFFICLYSRTMTSLHQYFQFYFQDSSFIVAHVFILQKKKKKLSVVNIEHFLRVKWGIFYLQPLSLILEICNTNNGFLRQCKPAIFILFSGGIASRRRENLVLQWETLYIFP